ncbi:MAG: helix-turn-helix transcriptional regulator [Verrucomicrobiota bacterium]
MKESARNIFGRNVYRLRNAVQFTQEQLAEKADINRRFAQRIEAGEANPGVEVISRIRVALKCKWDDLMRGL